MFKKIVLFVFLLTNSLIADFDYRVENTNITISQDIKDASPQLYNYDRLRFRGDYTQDNFFSTVIVDGVNYYGDAYTNSNTFNTFKLVQSDTTYTTQSDFHDYNSGSMYAKVYRLYAGFSDEKNRVEAGLVNISMGVGRIWNPTNIFNPKNIYALEPDEVFGVSAISYVRHLNDTSSIKVVASQSGDESFKYAAMYKSFFDFAELGIDVISSDKTLMLGYEIEGNLFDSGVEIRSEGAYIKNSLQTSTSATSDEDFFQALIGADYGFVNGITFIAEALYSSKEFSYSEQLLNYQSEISQNLVASKFYTALSVSYSFNIFLDASLLYIESFNDENSRFIAPSLTYTFNDNNLFTLSAMMQDGSSESEFGRGENSYSFKWSLSF